MFKGLNPLTKTYIVVISCLLAVSYWNFRSWTHSKSIVFEIKPEAKRQIASVEQKTKTIKTRQVQKLEVDCNRDQKILSQQKFVRLKLKNCGENIRLVNRNNHFEASLWQRDDTWYSDYIPLQTSENSLEIFGQGENDTRRIVIDVQNSTHDAI